MWKGTRQTGVVPIHPIATIESILQLVCPFAFSLRIHPLRDNLRLLRLVLDQELVASVRILALSALAPSSIMVIDLLTMLKLPVFLSIIILQGSIKVFLSSLALAIEIVSHVYFLALNNCSVLLPRVVLV